MNTQKKPNRKQQMEHFAGTLIKAMLVVMVLYVIVLSAVFLLIGISTPPDSVPMRGQCSEQTPGCEWQVQP